MEHVLEVKNLTKVFRTRNSDFTAVDHVSFTVKEGEIVGLLGPNGAGKTTTIQMLLGLVTPTSGEIRYFGREFAKNREYCLSRINFASAYNAVQNKLTVRQNLTIYAGLYGVKNAKERIEELLVLLHIEGFADRLFWKLSSGEKTRVILAKALINKPRILLMDEPTASLDPEIVERVMDLVIDLQKKEQVAILYTSHQMDEVEKICDRVLFLQHGKIIVEDTPLELTKKVGKIQLMITFDGIQKPIISFLTKEHYAFRFPRTHVVAVSVDEPEIPKVLFGLAKKKVWMTAIAIEKPDLEDVFLSIAKERYAISPN